MAKPRFRVTGFARFILMLVIVTPLAYLGASYINGENGIENIRNFLRGEEQEHQETSPTTEDSLSPAVPAPAAPTPATDPELERIRRELDFQTRMNQNLKEENEALKRSIWEKDQEIARLKEATN